MSKEAINSSSAVEFAINKVRPISDGSPLDPAIGFESNPTIGWYLNNTGEVVFTMGLDDNILQSVNFTEFRKPLLINEHEPGDIFDNRGYLYKKPGDDGLWWKTATDDINLANSGSRVNMKMSISNDVMPNYSFSNDPNTGLFLESPGCMRFSAEGHEVARFTPDNMCIFKPMQIMESSVLNEPSLSMGTLYKKPGSDGLFWRTTNKEVELTHDLPDNFTQPNGSSKQPTYSFSEDDTSGLHLVQPGIVGMSIGGIDCVQFKQSELTSNVAIRLPMGSLLQPSLMFGLDNKTGLTRYMNGIATVIDGVKTSSVTSSDVNYSVPLSVVDGSLKAPSIRFTSDVSTGLSNSDLGLSTTFKGEQRTLVNEQGLAVFGNINVSDMIKFADNKSGIYFDGVSESIKVRVGACDVLSIHDRKVISEKQIQGSTGVNPSYSFVNREKAGMYAQFDCIGVTNGGSAKIEIDKAVNLIGDLNLLGGSLFVNNDNLLWRSPSGKEFDLTEKGVSEIPSVMTANSYSFNNDTTSGFFLPEVGKVSVVASGKSVMLASDQSIDVDVPIKLTGVSTVNNPSAGKGILFSKPDGSLVWKTSSDESRIDHQAIKWPLVASDGSSSMPSLSFENKPNFGIYGQNGGVGIGSSFMVTDKLVSMKSPVEIFDNVHTIPVSKSSGILYKEQNTGDLIWNNGTPINLTRKPDKITAEAHKTPGVSDFSWVNDTDTGLALLDDNVFAAMAGGNIKLAIAEDQVIIYDKLAIKDSDTAGPALSSEGHLYKKIGKSGLYWKTTTGDIDISQVTWPLNAPGCTKINPSYTFINAPQTGMFSNGIAGLGFSVAGVNILELSNDLVTMNKPLSLIGGQLYPSGKTLIWDIAGVKTDLLRGVQYPLTAPDGSISNPSYSFESDVSSGIVKNSDNIAIVLSKETSLTIKKDEVNVPGDLNVGGDISISNGVLSKSGNSLFWNTGNQVVDLTAIPPKFDGGIVKNAIIAPEFKTLNYSLLQEGSNLVIKSIDSSITLGDGVLTVPTLAFDNCRTQIENINGAIYLNVNGKRVIRFNENDTKFNAPLALDNGKLFNEGEDLIWETSMQKFVLNRDTLVFPLQAPIVPGIMYGFTNSAAGISVNEGNLLLHSEEGLMQVNADGSVKVDSLVTNTVTGSTITLKSNQGSIVLDKDITASGVIKTNLKYGVYCGFTENANTYGIARNGTNTEIVTGIADPICMSDSALEVGTRAVSFKDAALVCNGTDLTWIAGDKQIILTKEQEKGYIGDLTYQAGSNIKQGDVVCMDPSGNGKVHNGVGGRIYSLNGINSYSGTAKTINVFSIDDYKFLIVTTKPCVFHSGYQSLVTWNLMDKNNLTLLKSYSCMVNEFLPSSVSKSLSEIANAYYCKVLQLDVSNYLIISSMVDSYKIKISRVTDPLGVVKKFDPIVLTMDTLITAMTAEYDVHTGMVVIATYANIAQNFSVALVGIGESGELQVGTVHSGLSNISMADASKQIHLVLIPGGSCVLSYGICKLVFIISSLQGSITAGDNFLDYESVDCVDMLYDQNNGVVMSLEKTISGSCYIQTLDVLGLTIQKQSSRGFKNATMEPLGIAYLSQLDNFVVVYANAADSPVYAQHFDFDGDDITLGLRYIDNSAMYIPDTSIKRERCVFEIPGTKLCMYCFESDSISIFEDGYHGTPSGFLGFAMNNANDGQICRVMIKGHIYNNTTVTLPVTYIGKKLYLVDASKDYPNNLSTSGQYGIFVGTCLDPNRIILGL